MLRRDYFLRIVEQFAQMLARIHEQIDARQYVEAGAGLDAAFLELTGVGAEQATHLTDTELLARLTRDGPTQGLSDKIRVLAALLQEAGRLHAAELREEQSHACWLKALNLLLAVQMQDSDFELGQFIPTIDLLRDQLRDAPLPLPTLAALWRHYERIGAYGRAEDALFMLLEAQPENPDLLVEAKAFYERLSLQSDSALEAGNLPRLELSAGLAALPAAQSR